MKIIERQDNERIAIMGEGTNYSLNIYIRPAAVLELMVALAAYKLVALAPRMGEGVALHHIDRSISTENGQRQLYEQLDCIYTRVGVIKKWW